MSNLVPTTGAQRQRLRKHSFRQLPGGAISGSSTNPETIGRNRRRRNLPPLKAALDRIRSNKGNRISSGIRKPKDQPDWQLVSEAAKEAAIKAIRDKETACYEIDKKAVYKQYEAEVQAEPPQDQPPIASVTHKPNPITEAPPSNQEAPRSSASSLTSLDSESDSADSESRFDDFIINDGEDRDEIEEDGLSKGDWADGSEAEESEVDEKLVTDGTD